MLIMSKDLGYSFQGEEGVVSDEPEFHLVVGEVSLSHLVSWYQTLSPAGSRHLQQGCWLTTHTMQEREREGGEESKPEFKTNANMLIRI